MTPAGFGVTFDGTYEFAKVFHQFLQMERVCVERVCVAFWQPFDGFNACCQELFTDFVHGVERVEVKPVERRRFGFMPTRASAVKLIRGFVGSTGIVVVNLLVA